VGISQEAKDKFDNIEFDEVLAYILSMDRLSREDFNNEWGHLYSN